MKGKKLVECDFLGVPEADYGEKYKDHYLAQYLKYVDMADKISDRRSSANTFFLTVNTALVSAIGFANLSAGGKAHFFHALMSAAGAILSYSWYRLIRSYKDLNTAKFGMIHKLEQRLPVRLCEAEWEMVGKGKNRKLYLPFTHIEIYVPWLFFVLYLVLIVYVLSTA